MKFSAIRRDVRRANSFQSHVLEVPVLVITGATVNIKSALGTRHESINSTRLNRTNGTTTSATGISATTTETREQPPQLLRFYRFSNALGSPNFWDHCHPHFWKMHRSYHEFLSYVTTQNHFIAQA